LAPALAGGIPDQMIQRAGLPFSIEAAGAGFVQLYLVENLGTRPTRSPKSG
jgi:hypothetical protein